MIKLPGIEVEWTREYRGNNWRFVNPHDIYVNPDHIAMVIPHEECEQRSQISIVGNVLEYHLINLPVDEVMKRLKDDE